MKDAKSDLAITITLPLSVWEIVMAHLGRGPFCEVASIVQAVDEQAQPQIRASEAQRKEALPTTQSETESTLAPATIN